MRFIIVFSSLCIVQVLSKCIIRLDHKCRIIQLIFVKITVLDLLKHMPVLWYKSGGTVALHRQHRVMILRTGKTAMTKQQKGKECFQKDQFADRYSGCFSLNFRR